MRRESAFGVGARAVSGRADSRAPVGASSGLLVTFTPVRLVPSGSLRRVSFCRLRQEEVLVLWVAVPCERAVLTVAR